MHKFKFTPEEYYNRSSLVADLTADIVSQRNKLVEDSLEEYLMFKYNKTTENIKSIFSRFHNVKIKSLHIVRQNNVDHYFDNNKEFMTVVGGGDVGWRLIKHWEER